jgi:hypothetical protein
MKQYIKTKLIDFLKENKEDNFIKEILLNGNDWDDFIKCINIKYGNTIPFFHATTIENSKIIDKEGFKLVNGKNYISYSNDYFLYFQIGKSDYVSTDRPVLYKLEVPIDFLNNCDIDMDNVNIDEDIISKYVNMENWQDLPTDIRDVISYFIWNDFKIEGFELILHNRYLESNNNLFKNINIIKLT